jgi:thioredoxin-related protein
MKSLLVAGLLTLSGLTFAQDVQFESGSWMDVNQKAMASGKLIMVDAYTEWCGPCKEMDKRMFHDNAEVADLINEHFVSFKVDCERGFGLDFARKLKVSAYPTLLFFNSEGQLIDRQMGYNPITEEFIASIMEVVEMDHADTYGYDALQIRMEWPDFYKSAFRDANDSTWSPPKNEEAYAFLDSQEDLFSEISWAVIMRFPLDEKREQFFLTNYNTYLSKYKKEASNKIRDIFFLRVAMAGKEGNKESFDKVMRDVKQYMPDEYDELFYWMSKYYFRTAKDWSGYAAQMQEVIDAGKREVSIEEVNDIAWTIYENVDDADLLKMALGWFKPFLDDMDYFAADTYAALLYKTNELEAAEEWALKAIELGKQEGLNIEGTEELLEMIRSAE